MNLSINKTTTAGTAEYYDEAWVAIYNATDGEPRTSNLLGRFKNKEYGARYEETCNGKAAKHLNKNKGTSSYFVFTLTNTEISENLKCV